MGYIYTDDEFISYIKDYWIENGYGPSVREICAAIGLRSTNTVQYTVDRLVDEGKLIKTPGKSRTIRLPPRKRRKGKTMTIIKQCTCQHKWQDIEHGKGNRVHNVMGGDSKSELKCRCTVCGDIKTIK